MKIQSGLDRLTFPENLALGIKAVVTKMAGVKPRENVVVLSDWDIDREVTLCFAEVIEQQAANVTVTQCRTPRKVGETLPRPIESSLIGANVVFAVTWGYPAFLRTSAAWRAINEFEVSLIHVDPPPG